MGTRSDPGAGKKPVKGAADRPNSKSAAKTPRSPAFVRYLQHVEREGALIFWIFLTTFLLLALISYSPLDPGWSGTGSAAKINNFAGRSGAWVADVLRFFFGHVEHVIESHNAQQHIIGIDDGQHV